MIRALFPLVFLTACATFPQVDAATPSKIGPRPAYLSPAELAQVKAGRPTTVEPVADSAGDGLRTKAAALRAVSQGAEGGAARGADANSAQLATPIDPGIGDDLRARAAALRAR